MFKNFSKFRGIWIALILILVQLCSCQQKSPSFEFKLTKRSSNKVQALTDVQNVKSYTVLYNAKAYGVVTLTLADDSEYSSTRLDAASTDVLLRMLAMKGVTYNHKTNELNAEGVTP